MTVIVVIDPHGGRMFNERRQSRDRKILLDIERIVGSDTLWTTEYSAPMFEEENIYVIADDDCLDLAGPRDYVFSEEQPLIDYEDEIDALIVYRWSSTYPADFSLDLSLSDFTLTQESILPGYSHDRIRRQIYTRKENV